MTCYCGTTEEVANFMARFEGHHQMVYCRVCMAPMGRPLSGLTAKDTKCDQGHSIHKKCLRKKIGDKAFQDHEAERARNFR